MLIFINNTTHYLVVVLTKTRQNTKNQIVTNKKSQ